MAGTFTNNSGMQFALGGGPINWGAPASTGASAASGGQMSRGPVVPRQTYSTGNVGTGMAGSNRMQAMRGLRRAMGRK